MSRTLETWKNASAVLAVPTFVLVVLTLVIVAMDGERDPITTPADLGRVERAIESMSARVAALERAALERAVSELREAKPAPEPAPALDAAAREPPAGQGPIPLDRPLPGNAGGLHLEWSRLPDR